MTVNFPILPLHDAYSFDFVIHRPQFFDSTKTTAESPMMKKKSYKSLFWLALFCLFFGWKSLVYAGFCGADRRFLSEQELIERYLLGADWRKMTPAQREEKLASIENYPECCRIEDKPIFLSATDIFFNVLIWNRRLYGVETHFPLDVRNGNDWHYEAYSDVDACGDVRDLDATGISESEEAYRAALSRIAKYWETKGHSALEKQRQHHQ